MTKLLVLNLDCFALVLHFLTSLIKLILWLKFFHRQNANREHGGEGPQGPATFHLGLQAGYILWTGCDPHKLALKPNPQCDGIRASGR